MAWLSDPEAVGIMRARAAQLSEAQRIAFAIELLNGIKDPREAPGLLRAARLAQNVSADLMKRQFLQECV